MPAERQKLLRSELIRISKLGRLDLGAVFRQRVR